MDQNTNMGSFLWGTNIIIQLKAQKVDFVWYRPFNLCGDLQNLCIMFYEKLTILLTSYNYKCVCAWIKYPSTFVPAVVFALTHPDTFVRTCSVGTPGLTLIILGLSELPLDGLISHSIAGRTCLEHYKVPPCRISRHSSSLYCLNTTNMTRTNKMFH